MRNIRRAVAVIGAALLIAFAGASPAAAYPSGSDANHPSSWEDQFEHPAQCYKHEAGSNSAHGYYASAKVYVLNPFQQAWPGDHWEAIIVKAGQANDVFVHPQPGNYSALSGKNISHVIVCKGTTPEVTPSPSPSPSATPTASPTPTPTPTNSPSPSATPSPTPSASPSSTPTPDITLPPTDTEGNQPPSDGHSGDGYWAIFFILFFLLVFLPVSEAANRNRR